MDRGTAQITPRRLEELTAEARYARDRYRLYRARVHSPQMTSPGRLRKLERASNRADSMLRRAQSGPES
jgi:hypothetical protein